MKRLVANRVQYYSEFDEDMFFGWLGRIEAVSHYKGEGRDLLIDIGESPISDGSLRELLALFYRYGIDMGQLAEFEDSKNSHWLRNPTAYWYRHVFPVSPPAARADE